MLHSICQPIWTSQQWPQDWEKSVFIPIPKRGNAKECSNYHTVAFISHTSKVILKILRARLQQHVNQEFPDVQAGFRKGRGTRDQITNIHSMIGKAIELQKKKTSTSASLTRLKRWTVWITTNSSRNGNTRLLTCLLRNLYAGQEETVRTRDGTTRWLEPEMVPNWERSRSMLCIVNMLI